VVVTTGDFQADISFEFAQREDRGLFRIVVATFRDRTESGAGEEMHRAHLASYQSFNMTAVVGFSWYAPNEIYTFVATCAFKGAAAEIGAVVDMDGVGQSGNGPFFFYFALGEPCGFVVNRVKKTQTDRESRRRIHRQVESGHSARENIHGQGDPRPTNGLARFLIDDDDIHPRVINLDDTQGPGSAIFARRRFGGGNYEFVVSSQGLLSQVQFSESGSDGAPTWWIEAFVDAEEPNFLYEARERCASGVKYNRSFVLRINRSRFGSLFLDPAARPHLRGSSEETLFSVLKRSINPKTVARLTPSATHASGTAISGNRPGWSCIRSRNTSSRRQASAHKSSRIFEEALVMSWRGFTEN
jgi:hypothetical protein